MQFRPLTYVIEQTRWVTSTVLSLRILLGAVAPLLVANVQAQGDEPLYFNAMVASEAAPDDIRMAPGGGFFLAQGNVLRLWKVEGDDAVLVYQWDEALPGSLQRRAAVSADGSKVALLIFETRSRLFGDDRTRPLLRIVDVASGENEDLEIEEINLFESCGLEWVGIEPELMVCQHGTGLSTELHLLQDTGRRTEIQDSWRFDNFFYHDNGRMYAVAGNAIHLEGEVHYGDLFGDEGRTIYKALSVLDLDSGETQTWELTPGSVQLGLTDSGELAVRNRTRQLTVYSTEENERIHRYDSDMASFQEDYASQYFHPGTGGLLFAVNDGMEALWIGERSASRAGFRSSSAEVLDFRVSSDGQSMIAVTEDGLHKLTIEAQRLQAMEDYLGGWEMLRGGFVDLGLARIEAALVADPGMSRLNQVYPYLHNFVDYLDDLDEELSPAVYGRFALAVANAANTRIDGELVSIDSVFRNLFTHGLFALVAGQPGIARQSLTRLQTFNNDVVNNGEFPAERKTILDAWSDMLEALILGYGGDIDGAYNLLAERGGLVRLDFPVAAFELQDRYPYTMPLWQNKTKLAFVLNEDASELDKEFQPAYLNRPMSAYPDLSGRMIQPVQTTGSNQPGAGSPGQQAPIAAPETTPVDPQPSRPAGQILD